MSSLQGVQRFPFNRSVPGRLLAHGSDVGSTPRRAKRDWESYIRRQSGSECQVVTAINIYTYLTGKTIKPGSKRYESLVDLAKARHGAAISIEKVHKRLGIEPFKEYSALLLAVGKLPLEISVWHKAYGFHSVAAVEWEPRTESYRIPNFDRATNLHGWIYFEDLAPLVRSGRMHKTEWEVRTFRLRKS